MAGSMIIDVDKDAKELVIPETATYFLHNRHDVTFLRELCKSYDKIIVKNSSLFSSVFCIRMQRQRISLLIVRCMMIKKIFAIILKIAAICKIFRLQTKVRDI